ncbi:PD-(D/E)XK nuclease family protein [Agrilactobacillus fermenti]|uniref:PD-(D/E)XK nuclease family protein n=1 Tax=Agrilactobacillus fermenti TaxID=2586909 RepID=UPI001E47FB23|nr:PD-(D/E)XK nuclease family protein [Agrilactobacillus fermenti]MCD2255841.1 PD-(D/E)XK nuclease family protein [Agrilactobacillus fermenti]
MSLNFLYGTADKDLYQALIDQLIADQKQNPQDHFFLLIPDHIKFEAEVMTMNQLRAQQDNESYATSKVQVFSFTRLLWYFLKDTQFYQKNRLNSAAQSMMLTKILKQINPDLKIFRSEQQQPGFLNALASQLDELQSTNILPDELSHLAEQLPLNSDTQMKLTDLSLVYAAYQAELGDQFITNEQLMNALYNYISTADLTHTYFYLSGFTQMTTLERQIVEVLSQHSRKVAMTLVTDKPALDFNFEADDLFNRTKKLQAQLIAYAKANRFAFHNIAVQTQRTNPQITAIGNYWRQPQQKSTVSPELDSALTVTVADNTYQEIEAVALKIHQLITEEHYQYRDFLVLAKHLEAYQSVIQPIFDQFEIPYFDDLPIPMRDHPLLAFLTNLFAIDRFDYRYEDLMQLLKTELLLPKLSTGDFLEISIFRNDLDITDNYLLAHNLHKSDWLQAESWHFEVKSFDETGTTVTEDITKTQMIETIHQLVRQQLEPFFKKLHRAKTGQAAATALYHFLQSSGVIHQLQQWQAEIGTTGSTLDKSSQGYNAFIDFLDQFVAVLGEDVFNQTDFMDLLTAAFENTDYARIPTTLDAVNVSEVGKVQMGNRKMTFIIGLNDRNFPEVAKPQTILNDDDREAMKEASSEFDDLPTSEIVMTNENYLMYTALQNPTERLDLSYARGDDDTQQFEFSPFGTRLQTHFHIEPVIFNTLLHTDPNQNTFEQLIGTKRQMIHRLVPILRATLDQRKPVASKVRFLIDTLQKDETWGRLAQNVFASLNYHNVPVKVKPAVLDTLFGQTLHASVSQLETFYQNPYAYFLTYGLRLQEREVYDLSPASRGSFYHEVMDTFIKLLAQKGIDLAALSSKQAQKLLNQVLDQVYQLPQYDILSSTGRMHYIRYKLRNILNLSIQTNIRQSQQSKFKPFLTEVPFGNGANHLQSLKFPVDADHEVAVRGKIDRIDTAETESGRYFNLIDYKSSAHSLELQKIYYGLSLQMLTYVQSILNNLPQLNLTDAKFASAFYYHLQNPTFSEKKVTFPVTPTELEQLQLLAFKYQGIMLSEPEIIEANDNQISGSSKIIPVRQKKDGSYTTTSFSLITEHQLETLLRYNAQKIQAAAQDIFAGQFPLRPVRQSRQENALKYSPYLNIFQFDAMLPENNYLDLQKSNKRSQADTDFWFRKIQAQLPDTKIHDKNNDDADSKKNENDRPKA